FWDSAGAMVFVDIEEVILPNPAPQLFHSRPALQTRCPPPDRMAEFSHRRTNPMPMPEFAALCNEARKEIQEIDVAELKRIQGSGEAFTLIDVRERDEQAGGMVPGAVALPRGILERDIDQVTTDKNRKMVLYCGGGFRSALAAWMLKKMGFRNVISLAGGWKAWTSSR
ncbi:MAG: rhodanese-like domain-containing protein, partial [Terriglobales bacterium]